MCFSIEGNIAVKCSVSLPIVSIAEMLIPARFEYRRTWPLFAVLVSLVIIDKISGEMSKG